VLSLRIRESTSTYGLPPLLIYHADAIGAFNSLTTEGLTSKSAFCGVTGEAGFTETEVEQ